MKLKFELLRVPSDLHVRQEHASIYAGVPQEKCIVGEPSAAFDPLRADPIAWEDELQEWAMARCVFRDRAWGGMAALHREYVDWSHATGRIPPATLPTFRAWVAGQGFTVTGSLVYGLLLAEDVQPRHALTTKDAQHAVAASERVSERLRRPLTPHRRIQ